MKVITVLTAFVIAGILGAAAVDKLLHWHLFVDLLQRNPIVPQRGAAAVGGGVVAAELALTAGMLFGTSRRTSLLGAGILFTVFAVVTAVLVVVAPGRPCGCWFAFPYAHADLLHVFQNLLCVALCWYVWCTGTFGSKPAPET